MCIRDREYRNNSMTPVAFGMKEITDKDMHERKVEADLTIIGIQAVTDTPLKSIKHQIEHAEISGIKMIIMTAENYVNVKNFVKSLKLGGNVIEAMKLSKMDAREFRNAIKHASAISNAIPELKEKIVEKLRKNNENSEDQLHGPSKDISSF